MNFELDHVFICTDMEAPQAGLFIGSGLKEGSANYHTGQGTANRRFFFNNAMIDLLWVDDPIKVQNTLIGPTRLWGRWSRRNWHVSPFGIFLRPAHSNPDDKPFEGWEYNPGYLPEGSSLWIGDNSESLHEPMVVYRPDGQRPDVGRLNGQLNHKIGFREISSITISSPSIKNMSSTLESLNKIDGITVKEGEKHVMNIGFDGEKKGYSIDFQPYLPLTFTW